MNPFELFQSRRCIRSYTGAPASDGELQKILQAANTAPTAMGQYENVHLTVITDAKLLAEIEAACAEFMGQPGSHPLYGAPTLVVASSRFPGEAMANPAYSDAAMHVAEANVNAILAGEDIGTGAPLKDTSGLSMTTESLSKDYPLYATSLLTLIKTSEERIDKQK